MNIHAPELTTIPERDEAEAALNLLKRWANAASTEEIADLDPTVAKLVPGPVTDYPALSRDYPQGFDVDAAYKDTLPDLQNGPSSLIRGQTNRFNMWEFQISACPSASRRANAAM